MRSRVSSSSSVRVIVLHDVERLALRARRDERQVDLRLERRRELVLRLLRGLLQALERHAVLAQIDAVLFLERLARSRR